MQCGAAAGRQTPRERAGTLGSTPATPPRGAQTARARPRSAVPESKPKASAGKDYDLARNAANAAKLENQASALDA